MIQKPDFVVFYAWQSDRPGNGNRYLIHEAASKAASNLNSDPAVPFRIHIDQDTQDEPGLCDIPATILRKIDAADAFLCDLTYVALSQDDGSGEQDFKPRYCSNPNVLFELGYAFRSLTPDRVICVMNEQFGPTAEQIFDLSHRRYPIAFRHPDPSRTRKQVIETLATTLEAAIKGLISLGRRSDAGSADRVAQLRSDFELRLKGRQFHNLPHCPATTAISVIPASATRLTNNRLQNLMLDPIGTHPGWSREIRGNKVISLSTPSPAVAATEMTTSGTILAAGTSKPGTFGLHEYIAGYAMASDIANALVAYLEALRVSGAELPWTVCISLLHVNGLYLHMDPRQHQRRLLMENHILAEPIQIQNVDGSYDRPKVCQIIRPALDFIWQEFGFEYCTLFTENGIYNSRF